MAKPKHSSKRELQKRQQKRLAARRVQATEDPRVLEQAATLIEGRQWTAARELLEEHAQSRSGQVQTWQMLLEVYHELRDYSSYCANCERLVEQEPSNPTYQIALAGGYMAAIRPVSALAAFRRYIERWPDDPLAAGARETIAQLEPIVAELLADTPFAVGERVELAAMHEAMLASLSQGEYSRVIELGAALLARCPDFVPAMNNLAQAYWQSGRSADAVAISRRVVEKDPDNYHALANLARLLLLAGEFEQAQAMCERLRATRCDNTDIWCKKAETFSFFGDDRGVLDALAEAERAGHTNRPTPDVGLLFHLSAVAAAGQGDWRTAQSHWRRALAIQPGLRVAEENLADARLPIGERHGPWSYGIEYWIPKALMQRFAAAVERFAEGDDSEAANQAAARFARQHRELTSVVPQLLDRGGEAGRMFAWRLAKLLDTPAMREALREFCLSQRGPDDLRIQTANYLSEHDVFPEGRVRLWLEGEWREIECMGFEISSEPTGRRHAPDVDKWAQEAVGALHRDDGQAAERWLRKCLEKEPDRPELLNNLAQALFLQGREAESESLIRQIHGRWPDYFFGRVGMATLAIRDRKLDEAESYLIPLRRTKRLHITEFDALANVYVELMLARDNRDSARSWLQMWKQIHPEHPALPHLERRISSRGIMNSLWGRLTGE